jgi:hypothetical protein
MYPHIGSMAKAIGRQVEASKYGPEELTEEQKGLFIPIATRKIFVSIEKSEKYNKT